MKTPRLAVLIDKAPVGYLWLDGRKRFCFRYNSEWIAGSGVPLSLSLPLRDEPYLDDESHPFFANLLPEQKIRDMVARNLGISSNNDFGLLERIGGDCAGAVSLYPEDAVQSETTGEYRRIDAQELREIIKDLPRRPLLAGEKGIRLSLAGAQKKLPIYFDGKGFHLPYGDAPSNYIIKPAIEDLDGTVENEAFCMALAHEAGLEVPPSFILVLDGLKVFVISRYDRTETDGRIRRLHQEDFCQALGIPPEFKYEAEGGPSLDRCFNILRETSIRPGKDVPSLLNWAIFNYLIGNSDAHAKNISLLLLQKGPFLAPFYDLLSTRIYGHAGVTSALAMKIGGANDPVAVQRSHWETLAGQLGIGRKFLISRITGLAGKIEEVRLGLFKKDFSAHKCDSLYRLNEFIAENCATTIRKLS